MTKTIEQLQKEVDLDVTGTIDRLQREENLDVTGTNEHFQRKEKQKKENDDVTAALQHLGKDLIISSICWALNGQPLMFALAISASIIVLKY